MEFQRFFQVRQRLLFGLTLAMSISKHCEIYQLPSRHTVAENGRFMTPFFHKTAAA
jgi:hypothetical protein